MSDRDDRNFILGIRTGKQNHGLATVLDEPRTYLDGTPKGCVEAKAEVKEDPACLTRENWNEMLQRIWNEPLHASDPFALMSDDLKNDILGDEAPRETKVPSPEWTEPPVPDDTLGFTPEQLRLLHSMFLSQEYMAPHIREWGKASEPTEPKFIDYTTLFKPKSDTTWQDAEHLGRELKAMALKYNIAILLPCGGTGMPPMTSAEVEKAVAGMTPEQQERYCTVAVRKALGYGPDQDAALDQEVAQAQQQYEAAAKIKQGALVCGVASPAPDCQRYQTFAEAAEKLGCPVPVQEWGKIAGIDMDMFYPAKCQPIGVDKADLFANGVVGVPQDTPDKTVVPVWPIKISLDGRDISDRVVAGSVKLTEPYYGSGVPNLQFRMLVDTGEPAALKLGMKCLVEITEPAPLGALTSTWFVGVVEFFGCLDASSRDHETKLMQVKCQGIGVKEDDMVTIKNNSDQTVHLPGGTAVPPSTPKLPAPFDMIVRNGWLDCIAAPCRRCTEKYFAEHPGESLTPETPVWPKLLAHHDGPGRLGCNNHADDWIFFGPAAADHDCNDYALIISKWNCSQWSAGQIHTYWPFMADTSWAAALVKGDIDVQGHRQRIKVFPYTVVKPFLDTGHRTDFVGQPNPHGEHISQYPDCGLFVSEADKQETWENLTRHKMAALGFRTADSVAPPQANDLHLHGIASRDGDFMLHGPAGETIMEVHATGDDVLVLHLLHRGSNDPNPVVQPVLWLKRWGEVKVIPGLHHHMNDLAQGFWRAVAQVHRDLPQPVSRKQEAILAFLNEHHMTLAEFDRQYYARPILHPSEVGRGTHETAVWEIMEIGK